MVREDIAAVEASRRALPRTRHAKRHTPRPATKRWWTRSNSPLCYCTPRRESKPISRSMAPVCRPQARLGANAEKPSRPQTAPCETPRQVKSDALVRRAECQKEPWRRARRQQQCATAITTPKAAPEQETSVPKPASTMRTTTTTPTRTARALRDTTETTSAFDISATRCARFPREIASNRLFFRKPQDGRRHKEGRILSTCIHPRRAFALPVRRRVPHRTMLSSGSLE